MKKKANRFKKAVDSAVLNTEKSMAAGAGNAPENIAEAAGIAGGNEAENDSRMSVSSRKMPGAQAFSQGGKTEGSRKMAGAQAFSQGEKTEKDMAFETDAAGLSDIVLEYRFDSGKKADGGKKSPVSRRKTQLSAAENILETVMKAGRRKGANHTIYLSGDVAEALAAHAKGMKTTKSALVNEILREVLVR